MHKGKVLIIEDDESTVILIRDTLEREHYFARAARTLKSAREDLSRNVPDLIILDRRLPDGEGLDFCRELRSNPGTESVPILFLTAAGGISDKITGLRVGGDDYLTKPFDIDELVVRVEALLRRSKKVPAVSDKLLKSNGITLDIGRHESKVDGKLVELWPKEFELLKVFLENKGQLLSKDFLAEHVWNREYLESSRTIEISVQRLRKKLGKRGDLIETVKGYGFKLVE